MIEYPSLTGHVHQKFMAGSPDGVAELKLNGKMFLLEYTFYLEDKPANAIDASFLTTDTKGETTLK